MSIVANAINKTMDISKNLASKITGKEGKEEFQDGEGTGFMVLTTIIFIVLLVVGVVASLFSSLPCLLILNS